MSAASFISMAGLISFMGYAGGVYLMGWTGGYVLLALLLAPYLRKFGHFTVPDFIGDRYDSNWARIIAVICAIFVSFTYVSGQMKGVGVVFSRFIGVELATGVVIGMVIVFIYATLGGMKGITWTQVAQYWVLISAFLIPAFAISIKLTGIALPQIGMGSTVVESVDPARPYLLHKLTQLNQDLGFDSYTDTFVGGWDKPNVFLLTLALMAGTAGLPHVIVRFYTVKTVKAARWSAFWALFFIALLYLTAPATGAFARYFMIQSIEGKAETELPDWFKNWRETGLVLWVDDGDGIVEYRGGAQVADNEIFHKNASKFEKAGLNFDQLMASHNQWIGSERAKGADARPALLKAGVGGPDQDIMVLATPEMAELFDWIIALVAAGGLAAALSTASGLLLVISSSIAHDLYGRMINPQATEAKRLLVGRGVIGIAVVIAGVFGIYPPGFVSQVVAFAFGLAAASFFPAIVLGIFSKRVGTIPAVTGMIVGIGFTAYYIIASVYYSMEPWTFGIFENGIRAQAIGSIGMLLNFTVTLVLTPIFPPPSQAVQDMIDSVREPEGVGPAVEIETAPEH
jgi:cation/acetate symporter